MGHESRVTFAKKSNSEREAISVRFPVSKTSWAQCQNMSLPWDQHPTKAFFQILPLIREECDSALQTFFYSWNGLFDIKAPEVHSSLHMDQYVLRNINFRVERPFICLFTWNTKHKTYNNIQILDIQACLCRSVHE